MLMKHQKRFTNRYVVSNDPNASTKLDTLISVEACTTFVAVKKLVKYILKGADRLRAEFQ